MQETYMITALKEAIKSFNEGEIPVGAVIVDSTSGEILAKAHNKTECSKNPTAHAEILAILDACKIKNSPRITECDMYVTLEPCPMCAQAISFARIRRLYFGAYDKKGGGVEHGAKIFNAASCHHRPDIYGGIKESESSKLLQDFFANRR